MNRNKLIGVYKITNRINGKVYIGQSVNINERWGDHKRKASKVTENCSSHLYSAIVKYGVENFIFEVIEYIKETEYSQSKLDELEIKYIELFESLNPEKGYNLR